MPNPNFLPLYSSGPDQMQALYGQWAGFNANQDQRNIAARMEEAKTQTNWLAQAASLRDQAQQRDVSMQLNQDAADRQAAAQDQRLQVDQFNRGQDATERAANEKARLAEERYRTDAQLKAADLKQKQDEQYYADAIDQHGQGIALNYTRAKDAVDAATAKATQLEQDAKDAEEIVAQYQTDSVTKGKKLDPSAGALAQKAKEDAKIARARLAKMNSPTGELGMANRYWEEIQRKANDDKLGNFKIDPAEGTVTHLKTGKIWKFSDAVKQANPASFFNVRRDDLGETAPTTGTSLPSSAPTSDAQSGNPWDRPDEPMANPGFFGKVVDYAMRAGGNYGGYENDPVLGNKAKAARNKQRAESSQLHQELAASHAAFLAEHGLPPESTGGWTPPPVSTVPPPPSANGFKVGRFTVVPQ